MHSSRSSQTATMTFQPTYNPMPVFILALVAVAFLAHRRLKRQTTLSSLPDILGLLDPKNTTSSDLLWMRSVPNARLRHAFNLSNTFVTDDNVVHKTFVRNAKDLIQPTNPTDMAQRATLIVEQSTAATLSSRGEIPFPVFIGRVTFKVILGSLFNVNHLEMGDDDIDVVANGINDLWQRSKVSTDCDPILLGSINSRLSKWLPGIDNPLNFVIPTFETMWRVVAVTVALVLRDEHTRCALSEYLCNPSHRQFTHWPEDYNGASVEALIRESLRLHPPTRRISRAVPVFPSLISFLPSFLQRYLVRVTFANIGALHRNCQIWGTDFASFDAMRHHPSTIKGLSEEQRWNRTHGVLAFGAGPLKCIAFNWAPQLVGIIVAAILETEGDTLNIVAGPKIGGREGWDGWKVLTGGVSHIDC